MKYSMAILWQVLVKPFYQRNTGLFLFLFVALFGVAQNPKTYHYQLMQSILLSPITLIAVMVAWLVYGLKTYFFALKAIQAPENRFLQQIIVWPQARVSLLMMGVQMALLAPIAIYATITILVGCSLGYYLPALAIAIFMLSLCCVLSLLMKQSLYGREKQWQLPRIQFSFPKPFFSLLIWHSFYTGKMKLLGVKLASFSVLFIPLVWNAGSNSLSDFALFFQVAIAAHALIAYDFVQFLEKDFTALRNMPIGPFRLFLLFPIAYLLLLLPEMAILSYYVPKAGLATSPLSLMVYFMGLLLFFGGIAYEKSIGSSEYTMAVAIVSVCLLFILPVTSFWVVGLGLAVVGLVLFTSLYYHYEPVYNENP